MELNGLDGSNPLGFLAALGTLRLCARLWPEGGIGMDWVPRGGWRPVLRGVSVGTAEELCTALGESAVWAPMEAFAPLGLNLTVPVGRFREVAARVVEDQDWNALEFLSAFGSEVCQDRKKDRVEYTDLCFITGSGRQNFLETAQKLSERVDAAALHRALFEEWRYQDKTCSFRWSPDEAKEYALQWAEPAGEGSWTVWGANRLAFEALPLFPAVPGAGGRLQTTGFRKGRGFHDFTWPIWTAPASVDTVRSLLALELLRADELRARELAERRIAQVFRAQRVRIGQGANFKVSFRPARAV
jgi:hypothetical protein